MAKPSALAAFVALAAASPAFAVSGGYTVFASFVTAPGGTFVWENDAAIGNNGQGGVLLSTPTPVAPGPLQAAYVPISFTWASLGIFSMPAQMIFRARAVNAPALTTYVGGTSWIQPLNDNGSMSIEINNTPVLAATFNNGKMSGTIGGSNVITNFDSGTGSVVFSSVALLPIPIASVYYVQLVKNQLPPPYTQVALGKAVSSFDPPTSGSFAFFVPEPGSWALLIVGFGLVGAALRRRRAQPA